MDIQIQEQLLNSASKIHTRSTYYGDSNPVPLVALQMIYELLADCHLILEFDCIRKLQHLAADIINCNPDICHLRDDSVFLEENIDNLVIKVETQTNVFVNNIEVTFGNGLIEYEFLAETFNNATATSPIGIVNIVTLPAIGTLYFDGVPVTPGLKFEFTDIGKLTYNRIDNIYQDTFVFQISNNETPKILSNMATFSIDVAGRINEPATVGDASQSTAYSTTIVFTRAMFTTATTPPYNDPEGDAAATLKITSLPATGEIQLDGSPILVNDEFDFTTVIDAGRLTYVPDAGTTTAYVDPFSFEIADAGSGQFAG